MKFHQLERSRWMSSTFPSWRHHGSERFHIAHVFYVMCIKFPNLVTADSFFQSIFWKAFVGCSLTKCHRPLRLNWTVSGVWPTIEALMSIGLFRFLALKNWGPVLILMQVWLTFLICSNELLSDCLGMPEMSSGRYFSSFPLGGVPSETRPSPVARLKDTSSLILLNNALLSI